MRKYFWAWAMLFLGAPAAQAVPAAGPEHAFTPHDLFDWDLQNSPVLTTANGQPVIIDGRTFSRAYQVDRLLRFEETVEQRLNVIECLCPDEVVLDRLERDRLAGTHPAGNRDFELYLSQKVAADPLTIPRLVLDTSAVSPDECVYRCMEFFKEG